MNIFEIIENSDDSKLLSLSCDENEVSLIM